MLIGILGGFVLGVVVLLIVIALRPSEFRIVRSTTIAAPAAAIFPHLNDFKKHRAWSPWVKLDPAAKYAYEGPASGVGARMAWKGNGRAGAGRQTIVNSVPQELVRVKLEFFKPFPSTSTTEFELKPDATTTTVSWILYGKNTFPAKAFGLLMNQDKMLGGFFEEGLASLKKLVETVVPTNR